jgi:acyl-CoA thioesterase-1
MPFRLAWRSTLLSAALVLVGAPSVAKAQIVAFGASNVSGDGVALEDAFPAQLEAMLRAKGYDVHVANEGVGGDTSADMLRRLDNAVPPATRIVLLDTSGPISNNPHRGISREQGAAHMAAIAAKLEARHITIIRESANVIPRQYRQADGRHLSAEGHRLLATRLLPDVTRALGPPSR